MGTSKNPKLCVTLHRQNAHLLQVNSAFLPPLKGAGGCNASVASLDFGVFRSPHKLNIYRMKTYFFIVWIGMFTCIQCLGIQASNRVKIATIGGGYGIVHADNDSQNPQNIVDRMIAHWKREINKVLIHKPDLIVLTEVCDSPAGLTKQEQSAYYSVRKNQIQDFFASVAKENRCYIAFGTKREENGDWYNACVMLDRQGQVAGVYHKNFPTVYEMPDIKPGTETPIIQCDFGRVGCIICFDLNFDELRERYATLKPDVMLFLSLYHGGLVQSQWAYSCRSYFVCSYGFREAPSEIRNPFGEVVASSTHFDNYAVATVNLDREMVHLDENGGKLIALKQKYGDKVQIYDPGKVGALLITSEHDRVSAAEMVNELKIELLDDYFNRSRQVKNKNTISTSQSPVEYINSNFEAASPVLWEYNTDGSVTVHMLYDHERNSPNRANYHVHFQVQAKQGSDVTLRILYNNDIYNGQKVASAYTNYRNYFISDDGKQWTAIPLKNIADGHQISVHMNTDRLYVANIEPYRISDLDRFLSTIKDHPLVKIESIGQTVEGRSLEIVRVGHPSAPFRVFIRARAHPWESGGSWVVQGLVNSLLAKDEDNAKYFDKFCLYILPMANKDGIARGHTRFNSLGRDLNRNMNLPADPQFVPENYAMEAWLKKMIGQGMKPQLAIDIHNDQHGPVFWGHPDNLKKAEYKDNHSTTFSDHYLLVDKNADVKKFESNILKFESLMVQQTWYDQISANAQKYPAGAEKAATPRYNVDLACVLELNQVVISRWNKIPFGKDWELLGKQMRDVFYHYFDR